MIEKQYRTKKKTMYFKIHDSWISKNLTINNDIKCNMQSEVTTEDEIILLINPLIINGGTDSYDLNERNKFKETKTRSTQKSISWRVIAFLNSWFILAVSLTEVPLWNAIIMNLTGILFFYIHERVWNNVDFGRYSEESK